MTRKWALGSMQEYVGQNTWFTVKNNVLTGTKLTNLVGVRNQQKIFSRSFMKVSLSCKQIGQQMIGRFSLPSC